MKFKSQDKQNQLIENITVNHLVVGVTKKAMDQFHRRAIVSVSVITNHSNGLVAINKFPSLSKYLWISSTSLVSQKLYFPSLA